MGLKYCALLSEGTMLIHMSGLYKMLQTRAVSGCILLEGNILIVGGKIVTFYLEFFKKKGWQLAPL